MYKVQEYTGIIGEQDADTRRQYRIIEKLSKGFTAEHGVAREMDELLAERLGTRQPGENHAGEASMDDLSEKFNDLFNALKSRQAPGKEELTAAVHEVLDSVKISIGHLDDGVQKMLRATATVIKYELPPPAKTAPFRKPGIPAFQQIVDDVISGNNVMLVGGAGTGKTYLAENLIAKSALGRRHITINCSQWTSPTEIIGGQTMDGYVEGKLIEAWRSGMVLILDELPKIDPNTAGLFNDALAKTKTKDAVIFNSRRESFTKHNDFAVIATGNIYPDKESMAYGANNKQDLSLLDRFSGSVHFIGKNPAIEREILGNDMVWSLCDLIREAVAEMKYEAQVSLRLMVNCRDAYNLEMARVKDKGRNGVGADDGKTLKSTVDCYLSTFTDVQRTNIHQKARYKEYFQGHRYRSLDPDKKAY